MSDPCLQLDHPFYWEGLWGRHIPERYRKNRRDAFAQLGLEC